MSRQSHPKLILSLIVALFLWTLSGAISAAAAPEATCTSNGTGNWTAIVWTGCASGPQNGDTVIIAAGSTVTLNTNTPTLASLTVNGILTVGDSNTARTITVNGPVVNSDTIQPRGIGTATLHQLLIQGNLTNNGTFNAVGTGNPKIITTFNGTALQTISGSSPVAFHDLTINNNALVAFPATNIPTVNNVMTNNGTVQQTRTVNNANVPFLTISTDRYRGVDIDTTGTGANLGAVTVTIRGNSGFTCPNTTGATPVYVSRCFDITPTTQGAAAVTLWATTAEQNGILTSNLTPFRFSSSWEQLTNVTNGTGSNNYIFAEGDTPGLSSFLLGDTNFSPTAITLEQAGIIQGISWLWVALTGLLLLVSVAWWVKRVNSKQ